MTDVTRYTLFGFPVDGFDKPSLLKFIGTRIASDRKTIISHINLHGIYCLLQNQSMVELFGRKETVVHIDGMPIVGLLRLQGASVSRANRLTYLDWAEDALGEAAANGWKVAYVGSTEEICKRGIDYFRLRYSTLEMRGWDGYFDMSDLDQDSKLSRTIAEINNYAPDLLIVGMGMPRQETFVHEFFDKLNFRVVLCCGAFLEYFVGGQAMPPRWTGRLGLEWLYRLSANPRRYANRYLLEPWLIAFLLIRRRFL